MRRKARLARVAVVNVLEFLGRERKAVAIAQMMEADGVKVSILHHFTDADWLMYAQAAGYKRKTAPSLECRQMVRVMLQGERLTV